MSPEEKKARFIDLLGTFEGTSTQATLYAMAEELGQDGAFDLVSLIISRADTIAELWKNEGGK